MTGPWSAVAAANVGLDWLEAELRPASRFGRRALQSARAFLPGDEAAARVAIAGVARAARALDPGAVERLRASIARVPDAAEAIVRARAGEVLGDADFFEIASLLGALREVGDATPDPAPLGDAASPLRALPPVPAELANALAPGRGERGRFYLDDAFAAELGAARAELAAHQAAYDAARGHILERIAAALGEPVRDGEFVVMREAYGRGALPAEIRVVQEAPTYWLCEALLDETALRAAAALEAAHARVATVEERVRERLSAAVSAAAQALLDAFDRIGDLDAFLARVAFAQRYGCVEPHIVDAPELTFEDARYLPLATALGSSRPYAAISLELHGAAVLAGPNMGGKSTALRTCGFLAACLACGLPVPARSARLSLFDEIVWLGSAEGDAPERLLSSFATEIAALQAFFERGRRAPLVLVDEFARTTAPGEGRALLAALLERLAESGAIALAATHLAPLDSGAIERYATRGWRDDAFAGEAGGEDVLSTLARSIDYTIVRVAPGAPSPPGALRVAELLGLDARTLALARQKL